MYFRFASDLQVKANVLYNDVRPIGSPPLQWYFKLVMEAEPLEVTEKQEPPPTKWGETVYYMAWRLNTADNEFVRPPRGAQTTARRSRGGTREANHVHAPLMPTCASWHTPRACIADRAGPGRLFPSLLTVLSSQWHDRRRLLSRPQPRAVLARGFPDQGEHLPRQ